MFITSGRCLISCCILGSYLLLTRKSLRITKGSLIGAGCVAGTNILYIVSNQLTTAANAILLQYTAPVFVILIMWLVFHDRPKRLDVLACLAVFVGIFFFFVDGVRSGVVLGNLLALLSGGAYAGIFIMNRLSGGDALSSVLLGHLMGALAGLPFLVQEMNFSQKPVLALLMLGVFQMGLAYICFTRGIGRTHPVTAVLVSGIEPILNPVLVAIFLGELISPISAVGGGIVLLSITVYQVLLSRQPSLAQEAAQ